MAYFRFNLPPTKRGQVGWKFVLAEAAAELGQEGEQGG